MKKGFNILRKNPYEDTDQTIKNYYSKWREFNKGNGETFAMLYTSFRDNYLADLEGGALKLYLFFCFYASNNQGDSWWSIEKIADQLKVGTRTINKWVKVLVDKQLIYRDLTNHRSLTTYLLPYSTTLMEVDIINSYPKDSQDFVDDIIQCLQMQEKIFGEIIGAFHLFQWNPSRKKINKENVQWILFITKRPNGILTGHYHELKNYKDIIVSKMNIENHYFFHSTFKYKENPILGVAMDNDTDLSSNSFEHLKPLIEHFAQLEVNSIDPQKFINYGPIEEKNEEETEEN